MKPMMKCGHRSNAVTDNGARCCVICAPDSAAYEIVEEPNLKNRQARCYCGNVQPSNADLAFFEYRGPGSEVAKRRCVNCGYYDTAHKKASSNSQICSNFKTNPKGMKYDSYYCGCRGWD